MFVFFVLHDMSTHSVLTCTLLCCVVTLLTRLALWLKMQTSRVYSVYILCQCVIFSYASRFLKIHKHSAFEGAVCNLFKMFGVFGSSVTSSLSDVCQCYPVPFCKTSNELNIICQCHMKAECVFSRIRRS